MDAIASSEKMRPMDTMAAEENRTLTDKFMLRMPDGMRDRIRAAAEANNRSMNSEILATLEREYPVSRASLRAQISALIDMVRSDPDMQKSRRYELITRATELNSQIEALGKKSP